MISNRRTPVEAFTPTLTPAPTIFRPRRLRKSSSLRNLVQENTISVSDLIFPLFIKAGNTQKHSISSMPGHFQLSLNDLEEEVKEIQQLNIPAVLLFGIPKYKDAMGSCALEEEGIIQESIRLIKKVAPELLVITDLCFCEYTDHGHCGIYNPDKNSVDNDQTLHLLAKQAVSHARAGADIIAPSGMMDGMVRSIRKALDQHHFEDIPILSYAVKYASSFYGPFREAAEGAPQYGDRKSYQMNPANSHEALKEARLDIEEGADLLMVKPAQHYLDVIYRIKKTFPEIPLCAYQVSGEFAMIKAAAEKNWIDEKSAMMESLLSIKRAGADFIITYFAKEFANFANSEFRGASR